MTIDRDMELGEGGNESPDCKSVRRFICGLFV